MENLYIQTSQNVAIEHNIASVGERIIARMLDYLFIGLYFMVMLFIFSFSGSDSPAIFIILFLPVVLYDLIFEIVFNGQSPGKRIIKLQVVMMDGSQPGISNYFIRWIFRLVDITLTSGGVAVLTIILNGKGQRLGDIAAKTSVIRLKNEVHFSETLFTELPENYRVKYPEVSRLDDKDIHTVKEVLTDLVHTNYSSLSVQLAAKLKQALEKKMNVKSEDNYRDFFQTVLMDYNYYGKAS
jgi:uncharacterized RDD family membrane protein YckC